MKQNRMLKFVVLCICLASIMASAQEDQSATGQSTSVPPKETKIGNYVASGSIEAGYRFTDTQGASFDCGTPGGICNYVGMYNTLVNLRQGPRVFDQSLSLRAVGNTGVLFDDLYANTYGWGGDPDNVARLRVSKRKVYNLTVMFRRDYSIFDYNLLANPLNPLAPSEVPTNVNQPGQTTPAQLVSPHQLNTVRRMTDIGLQLAPLSKISVRLGYNLVRYQSNAPGSTQTIHTGTEVAENLIYNFTNQQWRAGVDLKFIPRTTISFDGIVSYYKNDTNSALLNFPILIGGVPANEGVSWNILAGSPCSAAAVNTVACNQLTTLSRTNRYRSTMPAVMGSLESHYWRRLDVTLHGTYGWADLNGPFFQSWTGFQTRGTVIAQTVSTSPMRNHRLTSNADIGATYHVTDHFRISDTFRFVNQRYPVFGVALTTTTTGTGAGSAPTGTTTTATNSSGFPGVFQGLFMNTKLNETMFEFDVGRHAGVNIGYRYTHRTIEFSGQGFEVDLATGQPIVPAESEAGFDRFQIPEHTALGSLWFQPTSKFRVNGDVELSSAGISWHTFDPTTTPVTDLSFTGMTTFTRITPRHEQQYRVKATYQPQRYVTVTAGVNIWEQRNTLNSIQYHFHNRNYGITATASPNDRIALDLGYNFQDILQNDLICFVASGTPATGSVPGSALASAVTCPFIGTPYLQVAGDYTDSTHFGSVMLRVKPVKRATLSVGYSIVHTDGSFPQLNGLQTLGPTNFDYQRPLAAVEIDLLHGLALTGSYNYYDYAEGFSHADAFGSGGPTLPRNFHSHLGTIGMRYSF
jgi:opacity protein-like surface antigen